jgi:hypothetical protein
MVAIIRCMNVLLFVAPVVLVRFILTPFKEEWIRILVVCVYMLLFLVPVALVVLAKLKVSTSSHLVEEGDDSTAYT